MDRCRRGTGEPGDRRPVRPGRRWSSAGRDVQDVAHVALLLDDRRRLGGGAGAGEIAPQLPTRPVPEPEVRSRVGRGADPDGGDGYGGGSVLDRVAAAKEPVEPVHVVAPRGCGGALLRARPLSVGPLMSTPYWSPRARRRTSGRDVADAAGEDLEPRPLARTGDGPRSAGAGDAGCYRDTEVTASSRRGPATWRSRGACRTRP